MISIMFMKGTDMFFFCFGKDMATTPCNKVPVTFYTMEVGWCVNTNLPLQNTPMQYTAIFHGCKNVNFQMKS